MAPLLRLYGDQLQLLRPPGRERGGLSPGEGRGVAPAVLVHLRLPEGEETAAGVTVTVVDDPVTGVGRVEGVVLQFTSLSPAVCGKRDQSD